MEPTYLSRKITPSMQAPKSTMQERSRLVKEAEGTVLVAGPGGRRVWAPRAPPSLLSPGACEDVPGPRVTTAGAGQGTPGLGQTSGAEKPPLVPLAQ